MNHMGITRIIAGVVAALTLAACSGSEQPEAQSPAPKAASSAPASTPSVPASTPAAPEASDPAPSDTKPGDASLKLLAAQTKREMGVPVRLDDYTVLTNIDAQNGMLLYRYALNGVDGLGITSESLKARTAPQACANPETRKILRRGTDMAYTYDVGSEYFKYNFIISEGDCA